MANCYGCFMVDMKTSQKKSICVKLQKYFCQVICVCSQPSSWADWHKKVTKCFASEQHHKTKCSSMVQFANKCITNQRLHHLLLYFQMRKAISLLLFFRCLHLHVTTITIPHWWQIEKNNFWNNSRRIWGLIGDMLNTRTPNISRNSQPIKIWSPLDWNCHKWSF